MEEKIRGIQELVRYVPQFPPSGFFCLDSGDFSFLFQFPNLLLEVADSLAEKRA